MSPDTVPAGAREIPTPDGLTTDQALDIIAEIAQYYRPANRQQPGDVPLYRAAKSIGMRTDKLAEIIQANPYPGYDLLQVHGSNGKECWVLRRKTPAD